MKQLISLGVVVLLLGGAAAMMLGAGPGGVIHSGNADLAVISRLATGLSRERRAAELNLLISNRRQAEAILIGDLDSPSNRVQCDAAYLIGEYRMAGAVSALSRHILLCNAHGHPTFPLGVQTKVASLAEIRSPAFDALVRIGVPAISAMLRSIESSKSRAVRFASLAAQIAIDGRAVTAFRLRLALAVGTTAAARQRLVEAIQMAHIWRQQRPPPTSK